MKLKQQPDDFYVEELMEVAPTGAGPFAFYRLEKRGWATHDALQAIRRRWDIPWPRLSYGGLKDRHAHTIQYLTILHGPAHGLTHHDVSLTYLGQIARPYTSTDIKANRFRITLRDLTAEALTVAQEALEEVRVDGVPNYFDDQRFGSVGEAQEFIARLMVLGRWEDALRLALAAPYEFDRAPQKKEKAILRAHWGDWATCKQLLPRCHARSLVDYLVSHPTDFRGAVARMRLELQGLYLSAYQSHLWNRMLALWLRQHCAPQNLVPVQLRLGQVPMHRKLDEPQRALLRALQLPLPSARTKIEATDPALPLIETVLAGEGLKLEDLKLRGLRRPFFSRGERAALCLPGELGYESGADERHPGCQRLLLSFDLPRGSYATLIVKRITTKPP